MGTFPNAGKTADPHQITISVLYLLVIVTFKYPQLDVKYEGGKEYNVKNLIYGL